jgi:hypothetical protein
VEKELTASDRYGKDERLTEGYVEDLWAAGYGGYN